jgi:hypothetical protein
MRIHCEGTGSAVWVAVIDKFLEHDIQIPAGCL